MVERPSWLPAPSLDTHIETPWKSGVARGKPELNIYDALHIGADPESTSIYSGVVKTVLLQRDGRESWPWSSPSAEDQHYYVLRSFVGVPEATGECSFGIHSWIVGPSPSPLPPAFPLAWHEARASFEREINSLQLSTALSRAWQAINLSGPVREPHIESFGNEVRFTWNRNGHYLEFGAFTDGHIEWFYRSPDKTTASGEELDEAFFQRLAHARP